MKEVYIFFFVVFITAICCAQTPQKMSYQAIIRNSSDQLVTNHAVGIQISFIQGSATGTPVYVETQAPTTNVNGLVTIEIGGGTPVTGTFEGIDWSKGVYFIKTETDPTGGTSYTITGTSQLLSVPYALYSKSAETSSDAVKITGSQTVGGNKTFTGTTTVSTPVNATDAATKAYVDEVLKTLGLIPNNYAGTVADIDGNTYKTVTIGTQTWMAENLRVERLNDGTAIPNVTDNAAWSTPTTLSYCWYNNDETTYKATYGALYNTGVNDKLCPIGWHRPNNDEWHTLVLTLDPEAHYGMGIESYIAGRGLKETGTTHWISPNTEATNETGFTALPGGYRDDGGIFNGIGRYGMWWSSNNTMHRSLGYNSTVMSFGDCCRNAGYSIRCVKD